MRYDYRTIDTRTIEGLRKAERLQADGWTVISIGFCTIIFERPA